MIDPSVHPDFKKHLGKIRTQNKRGFGQGFLNYERTIATLQHEVNNGNLAVRRGAFDRKKEDLHICGTGTPISEKWNVIIYSSRSVVTNDPHTLIEILEGRATTIETPGHLNIVSVDDAGWGFPLAGVMVGIEINGEVKTAIPGPQSVHETTAACRRYYSQIAFDLLERENLDPQQHAIQICTGWINSEIRDHFRKKGFHVKVVSIKGLLQDRLEGLYREYIKSLTGEDIYYDPKELIDNGQKDLIPRLYKRALKWGINHRPELLKRMWSGLRNA